MYNVLKFQAPFERIKIYNKSPDVALRKAIIMQAIIDATNLSNEAINQKIEQEAKLWLFSNSKHFKETCLEADLKPSFVVRIAKELISLHKEKINKLSSIKKIKVKTLLINKLKDSINCKSQGDYQAKFSVA